MAAVFCRCLKWILACDALPLLFLELHTLGKRNVCDVHFERHHMYANSLRLKSTAVPTLHLPVRHDHITRAEVNYWLQIFAPDIKQNPEVGEIIARLPGSDAPPGQGNIHFQFIMICN